MALPDGWLTSIFPMSLNVMSDVDSNKWPCCPVKSKGQQPPRYQKRSISLRSSTKVALMIAEIEITDCSIFQMNRYQYRSSLVDNTRRELHLVSLMDDLTHATFSSGIDMNRYYRFIDPSKGTGVCRNSLFCL